MVTNETDRRERFESIVSNVFEPLQKYLLRRVPRDSVDDVLSETLLVVWRRLDDIPAIGHLPWCYGVARKVLSNYRRSDQRRLRLVERIRSQPPTPSPIVEPADTINADLDLAIARLRIEDQELIHLWAWEQLEPREIAVVIGSTPNAVSLRLTRLKQKLAHEVQRQDPSITGHIPDTHAKEM